LPSAEAGVDQQAGFIGFQVGAVAARAAPRMVNRTGTA